MLGIVPLDHSALEISQSIPQNVPSVAHRVQHVHSRPGPDLIRSLLIQPHGSLSFLLNLMFLVVLPLTGPEGPERYETGDDEGCRDQYGDIDTYFYYDGKFQQRRSLLTNNKFDEPPKHHP